MEKVKKFRAERQVADAFNMCNGPKTTAIHNLPFNFICINIERGPNDSTGVERVYDTSASVGLLRQQWFPRWPKKIKDVEYHRRPAGAKQAPSRRVPKAGRWFTGFSLSEFSPHMYIRSDPNRTLSKE